MFPEFPNNPRVAVIGATGAIGHALLTRLEAAYPQGTFYALSRTKPEGELPPQRTWMHLDLLEESSIEEAAKAIKAEGPLNALFVATGLLHDGPEFQPEKSIRRLDPSTLERSFKVNAVGPALVGKHFLPHFPRSGRTYFAVLSARVGSISDNRVGGWYGYRASKAALNMYLKNFSIECARSHRELVIAGLQPGTVDSKLSKPFQGAAKKVLDPMVSAEGLLQAVASLTSEDTGCLIDWQGQTFSP